MSGHTEFLKRCVQIAREDFYSVECTRSDIAGSTAWVMGIMDEDGPAKKEYVSEQQAWLGAYIHNLPNMLSEFYARAAKAAGYSLISDLGSETFLRRRAEGQYGANFGIVKPGDTSANFDEVCLSEQGAWRMICIDGGLKVNLPIDEFTRGYLRCAFALTHDESSPGGDVPLSEEYTANDFSAEGIESIVLDCANFQAENDELLRQAYIEYARSNEWDHTYSAVDQAGVDFWLSRNGCGRGYWDRDLGEVGSALTNAAEQYGECAIYTGDAAGKLPLGVYSHDRALDRPVVAP